MVDIKHCLENNFKCICSQNKSLYKLTIDSFGVLLFSPVNLSIFVQKPFSSGTDLLSFYKHHNYKYPRHSDYKSSNETPKLNCFDIPKVKHNIFLVNIEYKFQCTESSQETSSLLTKNMVNYGISNATYVQNVHNQVEAKMPIRAFCSSNISSTATT